ncbi:hypothetical protein [Tepidibacter thalassicus]|uniref:DUF4367 domain-containing protein n=1 Tax=Tepidibacter thalassicus DSM 15285 TaxID=1123350 RepID=A0A1M5SUH6_9FIRM|nr:hypothetical protein [Tepidibacter thalassicus]SHH42201.1 hypothetical protein SAMN02744040_01918 [Tepidibacter thalassicus DSM 15285]
MNKKDNLDILIQDILKEDVNNVNISNKEIELEWRKFQNLQNNKNKNKFKYTKIASVAAIITVSFIITNSFYLNNSYSWKIFRKNNINKKSENTLSIEQYSSIEKLKNYDEIDNELEIIDIKNVHEFINFEFKQLPYELNKVFVKGKNTIVLNYNNSNGNVKFIQHLEGDKSSEIITVSKFSDIQSFKIGNIKYSLININDKYSKIVWCSFGLKSDIIMNYNISKNEAINIIKSLK